MVKVRKVEFVAFLCCAYLLHVSFYLVYLLYHILDVRHDYLFVRLVTFLLFSVYWNYLLYLICACFLVSFGLSCLVLAHVVFLHLFDQLLILSLGHLLISNAHMTILSGNPPHRYVDHICKAKRGLIDLKLVLFQEIEIEELPFFLIINGLYVIVIITPLHLLDIFVGVRDNVPRRLPNVPKIVNLHIIIGDDHRVVNKLNRVLLMVLLDIVMKLPELFIKMAYLLYIIQ